MNEHTDSNAIVDGAPDATLVSYKRFDWQSAVPMKVAIDGAPFRLADIEDVGQKTSDVAVPFTFQLMANNGFVAFEVVAHEISRSCDTVRSSDKPPESAH